MPAEKLAVEQFGDPDASFFKIVIFRRIACVVPVKKKEPHLFLDGDQADVNFLQMLVRTLIIT